jgi:hypothetical protein
MPRTTPQSTLNRSPHPSPPPFNPTLGIPTLSFSPSPGPLPGERVIPIPPSPTSPRSSTLSPSLGPNTTWSPSTSYCSTLRTSGTIGSWPPSPDPTMSLPMRSDSSEIASGGYLLGAPFVGNIVLNIGSSPSTNPCMAQGPPTSQVPLVNATTVGSGVNRPGGLAPVYDWVRTCPIPLCFLC